MRLYWQVYGTNQVANNELMIWFVKGYITQGKGHKVNWAKVIALASREKVQKEEVRLMKSGFEEFVWEEWG